MKTKNQKPTGKGGIVAEQFKTNYSRILIWFAVNGYLPLKLADWLLPKMRLSHE